MADRIEEISMTLSHLQGHSLLQVFKMWFFELLCSSWQDFNWHSASCVPSALAELLSYEPCYFSQRVTNAQRSGPRSLNNFSRLAECLLSSPLVTSPPFLSFSPPIAKPPVWKPALTRVHWPMPAPFLWLVTLTLNFLTPLINCFFTTHRRTFMCQVWWCIGFWDIMRVKRQTDRQTNAVKNPTPTTAVDIGNYWTCY